ncbi:hypothetical protein C8Q79DRAFT_926429 [Trametes meyenii]|nr:hypothetical protein C8Q79DRAFT_926429 [Trametes meyenii]
MCISPRHRVSAGLRKLRRCLPTYLLVAAEEWDSGRACQSEIVIPAEEVVQTPCGHLYHSDCLLMLVDVSMKSLSQFPPRCCRRTINTSLFRGYLTPAQWAAFSIREAEHSTPRRVYCANPHCSRFLGPREKRTPVRVYICPVDTCTTRTCARCKAAVPAPADPSAPLKHRCTQDALHRATLELGGRMGWARCPTCEELIERHGGERWDACACNERPPRGAIGRAAGRRDVFAPLQQGEDLERRLELWVPPTLQEEGPEPWLEPLPELDSSEEEETEPSDGYVRVDEPTAPARPNLWLAVERMQTVQEEETVPARKLLGTSDGVSVQTVVVSEDEDESVQGHTGACLPFTVDPYIIARGLRAQESRRKGPAREVTV